MVNQKRADTKPERVVRGLLRALGLHYRLNNPNLPGKPDFSNQRAGWAVFVHGCYWHHHQGCRYATVPAKNREWWLAKFARNQERDREKRQALEARGLVVHTVWECETRDPDTLARRLRVLFAAGR